MSEHLTEHEQVEALKKWWKENGTAIVIGIVIGLGVIIGLHYWRNHKEVLALKASDAYNQYVAAVAKKDKTESRKLAKAMLDKYEGTTYAALTAMEMAKQAVAANKLDEATKHLRWAMDHPGYKTISLIARQRLAQVLVAQNKLGEALATLDAVKNQTFEPRYSIIKGDILKKQGKLVQAREAYQLALTDPTLSSKERHLVQMKMDNLSAFNNQDNAK